MGCKHNHILIIFLSVPRSRFAREPAAPLFNRLAIQFKVNPGVTSLLNIRGHNGAMFCERVAGKSGVAVLLGTGHNL